MSSAADIFVRVAGEEDLRAWQNFVDNIAGAGPMHHAGWYRVLRRAFWVEPYFLIATTNDTIAGILPLYHSRSPLTGPHLSSLEEGILAERSDTVKPLMDQARALLTRTGAKYLQIRGGDVDTGGAIISPTVQTFIRTDRPADALWAALSQSARRAVRKGQQQNLRIEHDARLTQLEDFYRLYAAHLRQLGTPVIGLDAFRAIREALGPERLRLYLVWHGERLIGGMLCFVNRDRWTDYYVAVRPALETEFANYVLYWHVIRDAAAFGVARLDLARSIPDSNVHLFKRRWGGTDVLAPYHFYPAPGARMDEPGLEAMKRDKSLAQRLWPYLPLALCNSLGPLLRKQLPFI